MYKYGQIHNYKVQCTYVHNLLSCNSVMRHFLRTTRHSVWTSERYSVLCCSVKLFCSLLFTVVFVSLCLLYHFVVVCCFACDVVLFVCCCFHTVFLCCCLLLIDQLFRLIQEQQLSWACWHLLL
jgi:hypothetical protein